MKDLNEHIEDYLSYYLESEFSPDFAILLQGKWGCGKTWFIKKYIEKSKIKNGKFIYITLYGVSSVSEIEDQIFQQLHPVLSSKTMALSGKILKGFLRASIKLDLDGDKKSDGTITGQIPDINLPEFLKNTEDRILIFDDLERCNLPIDAILGYINSFVEHQKLKVILLANEDELHDIEDQENEDSKRYKKIKEKLIGKTFRIAHDVESAFHDFIKRINDTKTRQFIENNKNSIINTFITADYNNLRHLKQCLWDFERFYMYVPNDYKKINQLMTELLKIFFAFSFEIKNGSLVPIEIDNFESVLTRQIFTEEKEGHKPTPLEIFFNKYDFVNVYETLLTEKCWRELFDKGYLSAKSIEESLKNCSYCQDDNSPTWVTLWHYTDLSDKEFVSSLNKVEEQWKNHKFTKPEEILHICGLFLRFSSVNLIPKSLSDIVSECKIYISNMMNTKEWCKFQKNEYVFFDEDQWGGLGYAASDLKEFTEVRLFLNEKLSEASLKSLPIVGKDLLIILKEDTEKFARMIYLNNSEDVLYNDTPIFKFISPDDFFNNYIKLSNKSKRIVIMAFNKRYEFQQSLSTLALEIDFLENLNKLFTTKAKEKRDKLSGYLLTTASNALLKIIERIKNR